MAADPPHVTGRMEDIDGVPVTLSVNRDGTVRIEIGSLSRRDLFLGGRMADFGQEKAEEFAHLFVAACWEAGQNARRMAEEVTT